MIPESHPVLEKKDHVNPSHYKDHPSGIECIDISRHHTFNIGNVIKYLWRAGKKDDLLQDLKKAQWYLNDEIKRIENESPKDTRQDDNKEAGYSSDRERRGK